MVEGVGDAEVAARDWSGDVAVAGGHVRLGADVSGGARMKKTRFHPRFSGGEHLYIGRGS